MKRKMIEYLIDHPGFVPVRDIADALDTDQKTIRGMMPELMQTFWDYEIELVWKGDKEIMIRGNEADVRKCGVEICERMDLIQTMDLGYMPENDGRVERVIGLIADKLGVDLAFSPDVVSDLMEHVYKAVERVKKNMSISNPYMEEAREKHADLFEIVSNCLEEIYPELIFPLDEIGYIVLYYTMMLNLTF